MKSITYKLAFGLFLGSLFFTLVSSAIRIWNEYGRAMNDLSATVASIAATQQVPMAEGVQARDNGSITTILQQIWQLEGVAYAAVLVGKNVTWAVGDNGPGKDVSWSFPLDGTGSDERDGAVLEIHADEKRILHLLSHRLGGILVTEGIRFFLLSAIVLVGCHFLITNRLAGLLGRVHGLLREHDPGDNGGRAKGGHRRGGDELTVLARYVDELLGKTENAYAALAKNERQMLLFFDSTSEAIAGVDVEGNCTFANDPFLELLGIGHYEDVLGKKLQQLFFHSPESGETQPADACMIAAAIRDGRQMTCEDGVIFLKHGRVLHVALRCYPIFEDKKVSGAIIFLNDNREKRSLQQERQLLSEAITQVPMMIVIGDKNNRVKYINPATTSLTGYGRDDIVGQPLASFTGLFPLDEQQRHEIHESLVAGRKWEGRIETRAREGRVLQLYSVFTPIVDNHGQVISSIAIAKDISYELDLQRDELTNKKMEAVGRLTASFAHEFGNPLFGIRSVLQDIIGRFDMSAEDKQLMGLALSECERMQAMVRDFQQSYRASSAIEETSVDAIVRSALADLEPLMAINRIRHRTTLIGECRQLSVNRNSLSQVFRNILLNAIESMTATGGVLIIDSALQEPYLVIRISDGGEGIKREHQEHIFEPFFSTKSKMEGTGLGLPAAYEKMRGLGGKITFASEEGRGTVFNIHIPCQHSPEDSG